MTNKPQTPQGPDPAIQQAANRLGRTDLSPLEEVMFQSWANANQIEDPDNPESKFDFREFYKSSNGKILPPGQLKGMSEKASDIATLIGAQKAHDEASPMNTMNGEPPMEGQILRHLLSAGSQT